MTRWTTVPVSRAATFQGGDRTRLKHACGRGFATRSRWWWKRSSRRPWARRRRLAWVPRGTAIGRGPRERTLPTSLGPRTLAMPRARIRQADDGSTEWRSHTVRRYQRRTTRVDEAILGVYLAGSNTRRIKGALAPLLRGGPLSKD